MTDRTTYLNRYHAMMATVTLRILKKHPHTCADEDVEDDVRHTLWMIEQVKLFTDQSKIDRWVGWILAKAHTLGVMTLDEARDLTRKEVT